MVAITGRGTKNYLRPLNIFKLFSIIKSNSLQVCDFVQFVNSLRDGYCYIFIINNTMHTIGVDKITLFKTT